MQKKISYSKPQTIASAKVDGRIISSCPVKTKNTPAACRAGG